MRSWKCHERHWIELSTKRGKIRCRQTMEPTNERKKAANNASSDVRDTSRLDSTFSTLNTA